MFLGHFGVGLLAKRVSPPISLGVLFLSVQLADILWPIFLLLGIEQTRIDPGNTKFTPLDFSYYPFSHSLLCLLIWGIVLGILYFVFTRIQTSLWLLPVLAISHFVLDGVVHKPDLPLLPWGSPKLGLGLWNSIPITLFLEFGILILGIWGYLRITKAKDKFGIYGFWSLILFLVAVEMINLFSPPPSSMRAVAWIGNTQWLLVVWAYMIDKHRSASISFAHLNSK